MAQKHKFIFFKLFVPIIKFKLQPENFKIYKVQNKLIRDLFYKNHIIKILKYKLPIFKSQRCPFLFSKGYFADTQSVVVSGNLLQVG